MFLNEIYEDNAGNIFVIVEDGEGRVLNLIQLPADITEEELRTACKEGWPDADPYDPDDYCGKSMDEMAIEIANERATNYIAEIAGYSMPIIFPDVMGLAGQKLFKCGVYEK